MQIFELALDVIEIIFYSSVIIYIVRRWNK